MSEDTKKKQLKELLADYNNLLDEKNLKYVKVQLDLLITKDVLMVLKATTLDRDGGFSEKV